MGLLSRILDVGPLRRRLVKHLLHNFAYWQEQGVHVLPVHFYSPVPDTRALGDAPWRAPSSLTGVRLDEARQLELLEAFAADYRAEYDALPRARTATPHQYFVNNGAFESVDGEVLYCMVRRLKPRRLFEIGSGNSTYLSAQAALKNATEGGPRCELVAFEPYPNDTLRAGFPGLTRLAETKAQDIPVETFDRLEDGDILFIDSSHVLKIGSDVQYLYLEVLPRLRRGVFVHVHDIFLPAEYPRAWVFEERHFWNEQYLLQAFLAFNDSFEVCWAASHMHLKFPEKLEAAFASYDRRTSWPGSFWMRRAG